jgi:RNA polymerase sigma-70 factor (ECF subfamily)
MQDVFAKALTHLGEFRSEASPLTWLMKIATHHCLNVLRAERAPWHQRFRRQEESRGEGHGGPQLFEDREAVRKLLGKLDLETQQAAIHYFVDEMTLDEVAAAIGRSVPTVRKRLGSIAALAKRDLNQGQSETSEVES